VKILIAPDKFKGSLSAQHVCDAARTAFLKLMPDAQIDCTPLSDGGEGTFEILTERFRGRKKIIRVLDPLFRTIEAQYGISEDGTTAIIEMAEASGLQLLSEPERNPLLTTTFGTGQLIADAMDTGVNHIILGIGGSATNDAGIGMAAALGYRFLNYSGDELSPSGNSLTKIASIDASNIHTKIQTTRFTVLCDVENPLYGPFGAAHVYAPQKGASAEVVEILDEGLIHFSKLVETVFNESIHFPGAGAAGGLGAGAKLFLKAQLKKGIEYVSEITQLETKIRESDLIVTGEGKVDDQSFYGKVVGYIISMAHMYNKPVLILCGQIAASNPIHKTAHQVIALASHQNEIEEAMTDTARVIEQKIATEFRIP
jgi:glycerate kinase